MTRLENKPIILAEKQREPNLVFRAEQNRVTGFGDCNGLTGAYKQNGDELTLGQIVNTRMACVQGSDIEAAFLAVLEKVRRWKILGQHLELYDAGGKLLARFAAVALR